MHTDIAEFIITVQKKKKESNEDYEPSSSLSLMASFERYLRKTEELRIQHYERRRV